MQDNENHIVKQNSKRKINAGGERKVTFLDEVD
jgi:hypothetical protein